MSDMISTWNLAGYVHEYIFIRVEKDQARVVQNPGDMACAC